jgi:hypothetical protein
MAAATVSTSTLTMIRNHDPIATAPSPRRMSADSRRCAAPAPASSVSPTDHRARPSRAGLGLAARPIGRRRGRHLARLRAHRRCQDGDPRRRLWAGPAAPMADRAGARPGGAESTHLSWQHAGPAAPARARPRRPAARSLACITPSPIPASAARASIPQPRPR